MEVKTVYLYDQNTGEYLAPYDAQESPEEPGEFITPTCSTETPPPVREGCVALFKESGWTLVIEPRGAWYNAAHEQIVIDSLDADTTQLTRVVPPGADHDLVDGAWVINEARALQSTQAALTAVTQSHMDRTAQAHGYDNLLSAVSYADEAAVPLFQAQGRAFRIWRSLVWAKCHEVLGEVVAGQRGVPSSEELIAELPEVVL